MEALCILQQTKQEEVQKCAQVTMRPLLLGSTSMSIPRCLATGTSHHMYTQPQQQPECPELLAYSFQRKRLNFQGAYKY